jgi:hypothetical protein
MSTTAQRRRARVAAQLPLTDMTEAQFQAWVVEKATQAGWVLQFHVQRAQVKGGRWVTNTSTPGVPDLWLLRPATGQLVVLELKAQRGRATPEQQAWVAGLQQVPGVEAFIVRPSDAPELLHLLAAPNPQQG